MAKNIFIEYLIWHFWDMSGEILHAWGNYLFFYLDYFSVPVLIRTYFSHWHKYYYPYGRAFDLWRYFEAFVFNTFSRIIGALLRTILIIVGIVLEIAVFFIGLLVFLGWLILPFLLLLGLWLGVRIIF